MNGDPTLALVVGVLALVFHRQFTVRRVRAVALEWVALLVARGLVPSGPVRDTAVSVSLFVVSLRASKSLGLLRGRCIPLWRGPDAAVYRRSDRITLLLWLATFAVRILISGLGYEVWGEPVELNGLWVGLGVSLAAQQWAMMRRAKLLPVG